MDTLYKQLTREREIRILELYAGEQDQLIKCALHHVILGDCSYEALSYHWGKRGEDPLIECNGVPFLVTKNVKNALQQFRYPTESRYLWVDSICINQKDEFEKVKLQIPIMADIYENSAGVLVWLGKPEGVLDIGLDSFRSMMEDLLRSEDDTCLKRWTNETSDELKAIYQVLTLPWFTRVWTLQEVAMASKAVVHYGVYSIPWEILQQFTENCLVDSTSRWTKVQSAISCANTAKTGEFGRYFTAHILAISKLKSLLTSNGPNDGTDIDLMRRVRSCGAKLAIDRIRALTRFFTPELRAAIASLEYGFDHDTQSFYRKVAAFQLQSISMDVLGEAGLCQRSSECKDNPSWVPDWTVPEWNHNLSMLNRTMTSTNARLYLATGQTFGRVEISEDDRRLAVVGKIIDTISVTGDTHAFTISKDHDRDINTKSHGDKMDMAIRIFRERSIFIDRCLDIASAPQSRDRYGTNFRAAFYQTLFRGMIEEGEGPPLTNKHRRPTNAELIARFETFYRVREEIVLPEFLVACREMSELMELMQRIQRGSGESFDFARFQSLAQETKAMEQIPLLHKVIENVQDSFKGRALLVTNGGWIGLGPSTSLAEITKGDKLCVVYGCCTPFVIRPVIAETGEELYELVGEAYVYGLMDGEALNMDIREQSIVLV